MEIKCTNSQAATLGRLFSEAALFASVDQMRPVLATVRFGIEGDQLSMVPTDSFILGIFTVREQAVSAPADWSTMVIASELAKIGKELAKLKPGYVRDETPTVTLTFGERELIVECAAWTLKAAVVDGDFPNYKMLLPTGAGNADSWPAVNTAYLGLLSKVVLGQVAPKRGKTTYQGLGIECFGALKPLRFTGQSDHAEFVGLLMPVRVK